MKWHIAGALALALVVGACAQLDRVLDACMDGVVGPQGSGALVAKPSASNSSSPERLSLDRNSPASPPRLRLSLAGFKE